MQLHNEELNNFYLLSDITVMIKLGRMWRENSWL